MLTPNNFSLFDSKEYDSIIASSIQHYSYMFHEAHIKHVSDVQQEHACFNMNFPSVSHSKLQSVPFFVSFT